MVAIRDSTRLQFFFLIFPVTKIAIREARLKEIRQEILNSTKLQAHLADNPKEAKVFFITEINIYNGVTFQS